jgi:hypothetical protein
VHAYRQLLRTNTYQHITIYVVTYRHLCRAFELLLFVILVRFGSFLSLFLVLLLHHIARMRPAMHVKRHYHFSFYASCCLLAHRQFLDVKMGLNMHMVACDTYSISFLKEIILPSHMPCTSHFLLVTTRNYLFVYYTQLLTSIHRNQLHDQLAPMTCA